MAKKTPFYYLLKLCFTKEGKKLLNECISVCAISWSENYKLRNYFSKIFLFCLKPLFKIRPDDKSIKDIINNKNFWDEFANSIVEKIKNSDLAELKDYLEILKEQAPNFISKISKDLWLYPAKVLVLLSCIPTLVNFLFKSITEILKPINEQSPDLIGDVINALFKDIDGKLVGKTLSELGEIIRKFDTGDELIKESSKTPFENNITSLIEQILDSFDPTLKQKILYNILSLKNKIKIGIQDVFSDRPNDLEVYVNYKILDHLQKLKNKRVLLSEYTPKRQRDFPVEELSYYLNDILRFLISLRQDNRALFDSILNRFFNSIDIDVCYEFFDECGEDLYYSLKPTLLTILPFTLNVASDLLLEDNEEIESAREKFVKALLRK